MNRALIATLVAGFALPAAAQTVFPTPLTGGTQGPFFAAEDDLNNASDAAWFTFSVLAEMEVEIRFDRTGVDPDLAATLFAGDVTGLDMTAIVGGTGLIDELTFPAAGDTFGPLTAVAFADDTNDDAFGGPFGDPGFSLTLSAGTYSIAVYSLSPIEGGFFTATSNVPAPAGAGALALGGLVAARRRR